MDRERVIKDCASLRYRRQVTNVQAVPFARVSVGDRELKYVRQVVESRQMAGDGTFTKLCERWLELTIGSSRALLTHSGTAALEMAAILAGIGPGDEVILPSFTFPSTANAFVLRGAVPVFVDIEPHTFNIDPERVAANVTARTRAIVPVHYAGNACDMEPLLCIARERGITIIEDAAQALLSTWRERPLGSIGSTAALSFHQTKNVASGEGGALLINDADLIERAEIVREKGTNRAVFRRGEVEKYTWVDLGSSYLPGELIAAFLFAQLERAADITARRQLIWDRYHAELERLDGYLVRPKQPAEGKGNAHIYAVMLPSPDKRAAAIETLLSRGISAVFHYVPLHSSPAGQRFGLARDPLPVTDHVAERLLRLPIWPDMTDDDVSSVIDGVRAAVHATEK